MREKTRPATLVDLWRIAARRQYQRVLRLDPLRTLIYSDSLTRDSMRARLPFQKRDTFVFTCTEGDSIVAWIEARRRPKRRDEWSITTIGATDRASDYVWEGLFEEVCRAAGEWGVTRLFTQVPKGEQLGADLRALGFTHYADERIWGNLLFGTSRGNTPEPERKPLRHQTDTDAWDLMQLYAMVTPPAVRRAEDPTTRQWRKTRTSFLSRRSTTERAFVWTDETSSRGGIGGQIGLLTGPRGHWITLMYRPDIANRSRCPLALDYVLWKAARLGTKPVYCGVREYMQETEILLEERGFHPLSDQELLVKYLAKPLEVRQSALIPFLVPKREMAATGDHWYATRET
jgi:hypothetical protein